MLACDYHWRGTGCRWADGMPDCLRVPSGLLRTRTADLEFAFRAFPDEPVRARMAHVAVPQYQRRVRLDNLEDVCAFPRLRHGQCLQV